MNIFCCKPYFIKHNEKFIIRAKKNRNVIYKDKTINILKLAGKLKGKYKLKYNDKNDIKRSVKISIIPVRLCEFKKQSFDFENLRVQSLKSIRNLDLLITIAIGYISKISGKSENIKLRAEIIEVSKCLFSVPDFIYYAVADGIFEVLKVVKTGITRFFSLPDNDGQLSLFSSCETSRLNFGET